MHGATRPGCGVGWWWVWGLRKVIPRHPKGAAERLERKPRARRPSSGTVLHWSSDLALCWVASTLRMTIPPVLSYGMSHWIRQHGSCWRVRRQPVGSRATASLAKHPGGVEWGVRLVLENSTACTLSMPILLTSCQIGFGRLGHESIPFGLKIVSRQSTVRINSLTLRCWL